MISVNKARKIFSNHLERGKIKNISLQKSLGFILAEDVHAPMDVPSFDNSAKDGYALQLDKNRDTYLLKYSIQAGDTSDYQLSDGEAARIFTGAKMPKGADTVVMQEWLKTNETTNKISFQKEKVHTGMDVRSIGSQCKKGVKIVNKGTKISPGTIGLLASVGLSEVPVFSSPKVGLIITGNELKEVGTSLKPGEIYNVNGPMIEALLKNTEICELLTHRVPDDKDALQQTINQALKETDFLLLSGGISVGDYDFVEECLKNAGVKELFYRVKQRPGKPFFAGKKDDKWIFALPGNPASVFSCFNQYVKPCLLYLMGENEVWKPDAMMELQEDQRKKVGFTFFLKAKKEIEKLEILNGQQSFNLQEFSEANCLVELPEEGELIKAGTLVKVYSF